MNADVERYLRRAIGAALIQSGWFDRDDPDEADLLQFQNCDGCERCCACSGVPFLSSLVWDRIDMFGDLTAALDSHEKQVREKVAREIEQHADMQSVRWPHRWTMDKLIGWQGAADVARGSRPAADEGGES